MPGDKAEQRRLVATMSFRTGRENDPHWEGSGSKGEKWMVWGAPQLKWQNPVRCWGWWWRDTGERPPSARVWGVTRSDNHPPPPGHMRLRREKRMIRVSDTPVGHGVEVPCRPPARGLHWGDQVPGKVRPWFGNLQRREAMGLGEVAQRGPAE